MSKTLRIHLITLLAVFAMVAGPLFANTSSANVKLTMAYPLEMKMEAGYTLKIPMLEGDGPLFSDNNLKLKGVLGLSPVASTLNFDAVLTPIAVAEVTLGGAIGTGWDFDMMSLSGLLKGPAPIGSVLTSDHLGGAYYKVRTALALQFDTGAIFPGDWSSVLLRTYHELNYQGYTGAGKNIPWEYETGGAKVNGFNYKGEYVIGYKLPLMLNLVAVQLETYAYNLFDGGTHDPMYDLGLIGNIELAQGLDLMVVVQGTNLLKDEDTKKVTTVPFRYKRVAAVLTYSF